MQNFPYFCSIFHPIIHTRLEKFPSDPLMLYSVVNTKLRDTYASLDALCDDMQVERVWLEERLAQAGFTYNEALNKFW